MIEIPIDEPCGGYCPIETALSVLNGKWKPILIWYLMQRGTLRFSELRRLVPRATQKMVTQHLRELEQTGMVHREIYPQVPPKVEYSLTQKGLTLRPVLEALYVWGSDQSADQPKPEYPSTASA